MTDIFISYASEDKERAALMAVALEELGWSVWWDRKIVIGQSFDQAIEHELETAKCVVVLWSKHSIVSEWVRNEAAAAAERNALVPAMIDPVMLPLEFRRKQTADLADWDGRALHKGFQALCEGIAVKIGNSFQEQAKAVSSVLRLRKEAATLSSDQVDIMLVKNNFYDTIRNAAGKGIDHQYESQVAGDTVVVVDRSTGLMWQKKGLDAMELANAVRTLARLNVEAFAGFSDWRMPTLEEAMSLMAPTAQGTIHIDPVFQRGVNFIWTSDKTPEGLGWVVYFYDGMLAPEKVEFNAWTRPVRSFRVQQAESS